MENKNLNFFSDSYKYDIKILNNLQALLIQNQINKEFTLDHSLHSYLEEPFVGKNYVSLTEESVTTYSNEELVRSLNDLIKDYNNLLELFGKVNEERKVGKFFLQFSFYKKKYFRRFCENTTFYYYKSCFHLNLACNPRPKTISKII